jgi:hypothetical protein
VQQVLIARQQPVARLWPIASRTRLVEQALLTALIEPAARVALVGGEERGTWMLENNMASERAFAFAIVLTGEAAGAIGRIAMTPLAQEAAGICPPLDSFVDALVERRSLAWRGAGGTLTLDWQ